MVARLVIEPSVFKVSAAGQNVLVAGETNLNFNGFYAGAAKFIRGSISGSRGGNGVTSLSVLFGKTFLAPPMVLSYLVNNAGSPGGDGGTYPGRGYHSKTLSTTRNPSGYFTLTWSRMEVDVLLDRLNFKVSSAGSSFNFTIHYAVLDFRFGG